MIHYNLPDEMESYTHRSGRTARAGKTGVSIALVNTREKHRIRALEKKCNIRFKFRKIPTGRAICEKQLFGLVERIIHTDVDPEKIADYLPTVCKALSRFDREELIQRFVLAEFNRYLEYYRHAGDINVETGPKTAGAFGSSKSKKHVKTKKTQRFFINVGRLDKINEGTIVRLICDKSGIRSNMIGKIDLNREFSFFEVEKRAAGIVRNSANNIRLDGRPVQVRSV